MILMCGFLLYEGSLSAAPKRYFDDQATVSQREIRASLDTLRHEVSNHEIEIKTYEEKIRNLETIIDTLRQQSTDSALVNQEALKDSAATLEMKINSLETTTKGLVADLKQFKNHINETASAISQCKQKLTEFEKILDLQNQNLDNLQAAVKSLTGALQVKNGFSGVGSEKAYKVIPGDSLEKIARKNHTTIQVIKELNNLSNDRIIIGQTLKVP